MTQRLLALLLACGVAAGVADAAPVRVRVLDEASGQMVAARAYLSRGAEALVPAGLPSYDKGDERHVLIAGDVTFDLAPGSYKLRVERGLEYLPVELEFSVPQVAPVEVRLRRWIDMNRTGWFSSDMHVHRDPADIPLILRAEDLNFVPTVTTHVWSTEVSQPWKSPAEFPVTVEPNRFFTGNSQEIERIQGGPGALILLGRDVPLSFTGYELYPPSIRYARTVHDAGGLVEGDKLFWVDTFVNAVLGQIDFVELNCNHFLPRQVDTDLAPWSHWPMEFGYRGAAGFAAWMMDLYYRVLNAGVMLPLSAGSASGVKATPVGYNRVYVRSASGTIDYAGFMDALKQGRSFTTNGPILELEVDGRHGPGDRIELRAGQPHRFRARARWRGDLERLQLVINGAVVAEQAGPRAGELTLDTVVRVDRSSWAAVRVFEKAAPREEWEPGPLVFAHTSPIYLLDGGAPVVVRESVRDLLQKLDVLIAHTERVKGFRQERDRQETLDVYRQAREVLQQRLGAP